MATAAPFSDAEIAAIEANAAQQVVAEQFEVVAVAGKPIGQPEAIDQELQNMRVKNPGETIFNWQQVGPDGFPARYEATMQGIPDDMIEVVVYDRRGFPVQMKRTMAKLRIGKRDENGQPVFFLKPPVTPPAATLSCLSTWTQCRKHFQTEAQQVSHFQKRHSTEFQTREGERQRANESRLIELQERQLLQGAATETALLAIARRIAGGENVAPEEAAAVITSAAPEPDYEQMSRDEIKAHCDSRGIKYPANWQNLSKTKWIALAKGEELTE